MKKILVLKIGTSTLTLGTSHLSYGKVESVARQILKLRDEYDIILVSSGAIAAAKQLIDIKGCDRVDSKQAMAAIGQPRLMRIYDEIFGSLNMNVAQCLMTYIDFENETSKSNTKNTIKKLLEHGYIPVINENDTVATEEIVLGDNDKLSAFVASIVGADLLILASDIDGLFDKNPHLHPDAKLIPEINDLDKAMSLTEEKKSEHGTGGMTTKIKAAEICKNSGVEMWIVNGGRNDFLTEALEGKIPLTKFKLK